MLTNLMKEKKQIVIGKPIDTIENPITCYINQRLLRFDVLELEYLCYEDIIAISGDTENNPFLNCFLKKVLLFSEVEKSLDSLVQNGKVVYVLDTCPKVQFEKLCKLYDNRTIHWIH